MKLWLDDIRPAPEGWFWVKTDGEAREMLLTGEVVEASLDHDLGACPKCLDGMTSDEWLMLHAYRSMPNCEHFGTGYTLVCWMEETGFWPSKYCRVHSANPVGRAKMMMAIERHYVVE